VAASAGAGVGVGVGVGVVGVVTGPAMAAGASASASEVTRREGTVFTREFLSGDGQGYVTNFSRATPPPTELRELRRQSYPVTRTGSPLGARVTPTAKAPITTAPTPTAGGQPWSVVAP